MVERILLTEGPTSTCTFVISVGDGIAAEPDLAAWLAGSRQIGFMPETAYDAIALSSNDMDILGTSEAVEELMALDLPFLVGDGQPSREGHGTLPTQVAECNGRRVVFIGLSPGVSGISSQLGGLEVQAEYIAEMAEAIRRGSDIPILLSNESPERNLLLAERVDGLGVIVEGGDGSLDRPLRVGDDGLLVLRPGYPGRSIAVADLTFDAGGALKDFSWAVQLFMPPS